METKVEEKNELVVLIEGSNVEESTLASLKEAFLPFYTQAKEWEGKAKQLTVTSVDQVTEMKMAKVARLQIKSIRTDVEKRRKEMKEDSLRKGKAIDAVANMLKGLLEPIEEHLEEQEKFAERVEQKRKNELAESRTKQLQSVEVTPDFYDLHNMPEEQFQILLENSTNAYNQRKAEEERARKEEQQRIEREKIAQARRMEIAPYLQFVGDATHDLGAMTEDAFSQLMDQLRKSQSDYQAEQQRVREENERLRLEAEKAAKQAAAEKAAAEAEVRKLREKAEAEARKLREEQEAKLKQEREAREKAERELREKSEAEARKISELEAAKEAELSKGDKEKLADLVKAIGELPFKYSFKSKKYQAIHKGIIDMTEKLSAWATSKQ